MKTLKFRPKPLDQVTIYRACKHLLFAQNCVDVEDVQEYLSNKGYQENYDLIAIAISDFADQEGWMINSAGQYCFSDDTNEKLDTTLRKGSKYYKIIVLGKMLTIKPLHERIKTKMTPYNSNRKAMYFAEQFMERKIEEGYYKY